MNRPVTAACTDPGTLPVLMSLTDTIKNDMKDAMRAGEKARLGTVRMLLAAIKQREVDDRTTIDDAAVLGVIEKMVKQRRESVTQYREGGREDLASKEEAEIGVLQNYLPEQLSDAEVDALIDEIVSATGAETIKDMGRVMGEIKKKAAGRVDMGSVGPRVRERLSG